MKSLGFLKKNAFGLGVCMFFLATIVFGMSHHEMWRDEYEWFLFRKYNGILDPNDPCYNFYNLLCCFAIWIKPTLLSFQVLHVIIILASVATICFLSPFKNIEKLLISFGYFFIYEYGIITRPYSLVVLMVFLLTYEICREKRRYGIIGLLILLLAENNPLSMTFASGFTFYLCADIFIKIRLGTIRIKNEKSLLFWSVPFLIGSLALGVYYAIQLPKVAPIVQYKGGTPPALTILNQIWNSYIPIPDLTEKVRFWWTNIFNFPICYPVDYQFGWHDLTVSFVAPFIASLIIVLVLLVFFSKKPLVCFTYLFTTVLFGVFIQHFMRCYTIRYLGFMYIGFISSYWMYLSVPVNEAIGAFKLFPRAHSFYQQRIATSRCFQATNRMAPVLILLIFCSQVFSGLYAIAKDYKYKFSHSLDLAEYIRWNQLQSSHLLVGYPDYASECLCALLGTKVYFPQLHSFHYHDDAYNPARKKYMPLTEVITECIQLAKEQEKPVLAILNTPIILSKNQVLTGPVIISPNISIELIKDFTEEVICGDEVYWLYELKRIKNN